MRAEVAARYATKKELEEVRNSATKATLVLERVQTQLENIHKSLSKMESHLTWFVRAVLGLVLAALMALVLKG